jgi:hypothetical protein
MQKKNKSMLSIIVFGGKNNKLSQHLVTIKDK